MVLRKGEDPLQDNVQLVIWAPTPRLDRLDHTRVVRLELDRCIPVSGSKESQQPKLDSYELRPRRDDGIVAS